MSERQSVFPSIPFGDYRQAIIVLGVICLLIIPTGAAVINSAGFFTGPDETVLIERFDGPNGRYVESISDRQLIVNITDSNANISAAGVNPDATTDIKRVFRVTNTGEEPREIWVRHTNERAMSVYIEDTGQSLSNNVTLAPGESIVLSLRVDTTDPTVSVGQTLVTTMYIGDRTAPEVPLVADAGGPYTVRVGETLDLAATGSSGSISGYTWTIVEGTGTLADATTVSPTYTPLADIEEDTTVVVELTVTGPDGETATDRATISVVVNRMPSANAGGPYVLNIEETVRLDGRGSTDPDGAIAAYAWRIVDGPGTLFSPTTARPRYAAPLTLAANATVTIELTVTDADGANATDTTTVTVVKPNELPTADAGGPYGVGAGRSVQLDDGQFSDPDGDIVDYAWTIRSGPGNLTAADTAVPTYVAPTLGPDENEVTVEVEVTVTDNNGGQTTATTTVVVTPNAPPVIEIGGPYVVRTGETLSIDDVTITDPDGTIVDYAWTITDGPGSLADAATVAPTYAAPEGITENTTVTLTVTATDDTGATATETVTITVTPPPNELPTIELGGPYTVGVGSTIDLDGSTFTDPDGEITTYNWTIVSGGGTLTEADTATPVYTAPGSARTVTVAVTITDDNGATVTRETTIDVVESSLTVVGASNIDFGEVPLGDTAQRTVTVRNNGSALVTLTGTTLAGEQSEQFRIVDGAVDGAPPVVLGPGDSRQLTIEYAPTVGGDASASLTVTPTSSEVPPVTIRLTGSGIGPVISTDPERVNFAPIGKGLTREKPLTITNDGTTPLVVTEARIVGRAAGMFAISGLPDTLTLAPGETHTVTVSFTPSDAGAFEPTLELVSNDPKTEVLSVPLGGTGLPPHIEIGKDNLNFGKVAPGSSKLLTLEIANPGQPPIDLSVSSIQIIGPDAQAFEIVDGDAPFTLAPNEEHEIVVRYAPTTIGIKTAQLRIMSDAARPQIDIWMSNTGWRIVVVELPPDGGTVDEGSEGWKSPPAHRDTARVEMDANNVPPGVGITVNVSVPGTRRMPANVEEVTVKPSSNVAENATYDMNILHNKDRPPIPGEAEHPVPTGRVNVQYISVTHSISDDELEEVRYTIRVNKSRVGADAREEIIVRRLSGGEWNEVDATLVRETQKHFVYLVEPPGFSQFVVTAPATEDPVIQDPGNGTDVPSPSTGDGDTSSGTGDDTTDQPAGDDTTGDDSPTQPPAIDQNGVSIAFEETPDEPNIADLISITDLALPAAADGRDGPIARITTGLDDDGSPSSAFATGDGNVSVTFVGDGQAPDTSRLKGADALTLVEEPIALDGTRSRLSSEESIDSDWQMIRQIEITVPEEYRDRSARLRIAVPKTSFGETDPTAATVARNNDGWQLLTTEVVNETADSVILEAETPGFSRFAVFARNSVRYEWTVETYDTTFEGARIEPRFDEVGFYNASLTVTDAFGRSDTTNYVILVNDVPAVEIDWTGPIPLNQTVVLEAQVTDEMGNVTVTWQLPDGTEKTGSTLIHTFPRGTTGDLVVVAADEFGAQGQDSISFGSGNLYSVEVLSYSLQFDRGLWWLLLLPLALLLLRVLWWFLARRKHPPVIEVFEPPVLEVAERRVIIPTIEVSDRKEDLDTITVEVIDPTQSSAEEAVKTDGTTQASGLVIGREHGTFIDETEARYRGNSVVIAIDPDQSLDSTIEYRVRVQVVDKA
ncbi:MAG: choice-of-anchor D domain-containing protein, partial [Halobacteriales archaeon]